MTLHPDFLKNLRRFDELAGTVTGGYLVSAGDMEILDGQDRMLNYRHVSHIFREADGGNVSSREPRKHAPN